MSDKSSRERDDIVEELRNLLEQRLGRPKSSLPPTALLKDLGLSLPDLVALLSTLPMTQSIMQALFDLVDADYLTHTIGDLAGTIHSILQGGAAARSREGTAGRRKRAAPRRVGGPQSATPRRRAVRARTLEATIDTPPIIVPEGSAAPDGGTGDEAFSAVAGDAGFAASIDRGEHLLDSGDWIRPPQKAPRYANATLLDSREDRPLDENTPFLPDQRLRLRLDIGELSAESQVKAAAAFPDDKLPPDIWLDVMVSSTDFGVGPDAGGRIAQGQFFLPGDGSPAKTREGGKYLTFDLVVPSRADKPARARIGYYYRNILIQSQSLTARFGAGGGFALLTDFTQSDDLTGLDKIPERPRISIFTNDNEDGSHQIILRHPGSPRAGTDPAHTINIEGVKLDDPIRELRTALVAIAPDKQSRTPAQLKNDLQKVAPLGHQLYQLLPGQLDYAFFGDLDAHPERFVVQVSRPTASSFVAPWNFIYDIAFTPGVVPELCPLVKAWDGKAPLFDDAPRQCPHGPHLRDVLCPFGFWGFRYAIEQISGTDKIVTEIHAASGCTCVVGETRYGVPLDELDDHIVRLQKKLAAALPKAVLREGKSRAELETLLGQDIPFIYFFCHGNKLNVIDPNTWLAVGNNEPITAGNIIDWSRIWYKTLGRSFWNDVRPLVFINACHSLAVELKTRSSYLDAFIGTHHASGVIGTEVKVSQPLAMDVAEQFFASWLGGNATVESALHAIRMDYLKQGNLFGLVYTPYCWADLHIKAD